MKRAIIITIISTIYFGANAQSEKMSSNSMNKESALDIKLTKKKEADANLRFAPEDHTPKQKVMVKEKAIRTSSQDINRKED